MRCVLIAGFLTACFSAPAWQGDVVVKPLEREAVSICGSGELTAEGARRISRPPYLQSTTTRSTLVAWGSLDGRGEVILKKPNGDVVQRSRAIYVGDRSRGAARLAAPRRTEHDVKADDIYVVASELANLEPAQLYCYQIVDNGVALTDPAPLATAPAPGRDEPIRFVAVGDVGTGGAAQHAIAKRMSEVPFELVLFLGDIAYKSGTASELENNFFAVYRDLMRYVPVFPTIGNHERRTRKGRPYFEAFVLPDPERYYSFDWGDVHFVAIDTTHRDAEQLAWLHADLARNQLPWVIVYGHHPMYTSSYRGPQLPVRRAFSKILTDHKVDLVITGHEHQYERFRVGGVNYVVSGGGGGRLNYFWGNTNALKQAIVHHFLAFEVTSTSLAMKVIDIAGKEVETLRLTKTPAGGTRRKVDGKPETETTPQPIEKTIVPDETLHDGPDDDPKKPEVSENR